MNEIKQLKNLTESLSRIEDSILYVYDSRLGLVTELDSADELSMQRFNNKYGFHEDSLFDVPVERGVSTFQNNDNIIKVSADPQALAAEVESQS